MCTPMTLMYPHLPIVLVKYPSELFYMVSAILYATTVCMSGAKMHFSSVNRIAVKVSFSVCCVRYTRFYVISLVNAIYFVPKVCGMIEWRDTVSAPMKSMFLHLPVVLVIYPTESFYIVSKMVSAPNVCMSEA